ncbi:MAG: response regulator [Alphaproteobacteria bacterium]|nr:MAG: response regulator [Alphaproteobacteria bacterium]
MMESGLPAFLAGVICTYSHFESGIPEDLTMAKLRTSLTVPSIKILIIDDMRSNRIVLDRQLKSLGFEKIDQAPGVIEAVEKMQATPYDIIITDWNMPNGTGLDLLKACRQDNNYDSVAIVMATSASETGALAEALKEGATDYIVKPVTDNDLADHMNKILDWVERHK